MAKKKLPPSLRNTKKGKRLRRGTQGLHKAKKKGGGVVKIVKKSLKRAAKKKKK